MLGPEFPKSNLLLQEIGKAIEEHKFPGFWKGSNYGTISLRGTVITIDYGVYPPRESYDLTDIPRGAELLGNLKSRIGDLVLAIYKTETEIEARRAFEKQRKPKELTKLILDKKRGTIIDLLGFAKTILYFNVVYLAERQNN